MQVSKFSGKTAIISYNAEQAYKKGLKVALKEAIQNVRKWAKETKRRQTVIHQWQDKEGYDFIDDGDYQWLWDAADNRDYWRGRIVELKAEIAFMSIVG